MAQEFKVVLIGDQAVGKTSLLKRYVTGGFYDCEAPTVATGAFVQHEVNVDLNPVILNLWDTAGQEKYNALIPSYVKGADGVIMVYDLTNPTAAAGLERIYRFIWEITDTAQLFVCGNKNDLPVTSEESVATWAETYNLSVFQTSAKTGDGVDELFSTVATSLFKKRLVEEDNEVGIRRKFNIINETLKLISGTPDEYSDSSSDDLPAWRRKCCR